MANKRTFADLMNDHGNIVLDSAMEAELTKIFSKKGFAAPHQMTIVSTQIPQNPHLASELGPMSRKSA